ncbi:MAG TPA: TPM domain-containing protein [Phenylobacterium sp.]|nr:TPM domain-containing protein [Phenylobacterium sp.]HKR88517.1 TPM domain-containing protein [Phenylobacterium sp.]
MPAVVAGVLLLAFATVAAAAPQFPALTGRVVDNAHMLSPQATQKLDADLANLEAQTGRQMVVATIPDLQGYDIADYGYQLGRTWGIGRKGKDDGVVFIVAPNEKKVRIEVGYGLEPVLTDALSSVILQTKVLPRFRAGQMEQGVVDGAEAIIQQLALPEDQARQNVAQAAQTQEKVQQDGGGGSFGLVILIVFIFWVLASLLGGFGGRRGGSGLWWLLPLMMSGGGRGRGGDWGGGGGGGGFSGGGGSFGGGGSSGSW